MCGLCVAVVGWRGVLGRLRLASPYEGLARAVQARESDLTAEALGRRCVQ